MIRGGVALVYNERYFKANNKYMKNYDSALESTFGFMVDANTHEVDLTYPHHIRDLHRDFPLAPTMEIVPDEWLSTYQRELKFNVNMPRSSVPKLLQTVTDQKRYTLQYRNVQLYVQLGLIVDRIHRVLLIFARKLDGAIY